MSDAITRLNPALEGRYAIERELGEGGMTTGLAPGRGARAMSFARKFRICLGLGAVTFLAMSCGGSDTGCGDPIDSLCNGGDVDPTVASVEQLAFSFPPRNAIVNQAISPAVKVEVRDASGALVTTGTDAVTLSIGTNPATGTLSGTQTVNAVGGVATFSGLSIDEAGIGYTLAAASGTLASATSAAFDIFGPVQSGFAYVIDFLSDQVSVIDLASNTVTAVVEVTSPFRIAITPDGAFAYVTNRAVDSVSVIEVASNTVTARVAVGSQPVGVAITPDGAFAYVVNAASGDVSVIEVASNTVTATVAVSGEGLPTGVAITPDGAFAYVPKGISDNVSVIEVASNTVTAVVAVGTGPTGVAITPDGAFAYVTNNTSGNVSVIHLASNTVITTVAAGSPSGIAITP